MRNFAGKGAKQHHLRSRSISNAPPLNTPPKMPTSRWRVHHALHPQFNWLPKAALNQHL
jgi:hypothetical protein